MKTPKEPNQSPRARAEDHDTERVSRAAEDNVAIVQGNRPSAARARDTLVQRCIDVMVRNEWVRGVTAPELAAEFGVSLSVAEAASSEAARHLRLIRQPDMLREHCLNEARKVLENHDEPMVKLNAIKVILDNLDKGQHNPRGKQPAVIDTTASATGPERVAKLREYLRTPDEELAEALEAEGWKRG